MDLYILRHGEAGKRLSSSSGNKDFARPLTVTGQKEVADIAASLKYLGIKFDLITTSPLKSWFKGLQKSGESRASCSTSW
jgi:phosphohistidine phosphatase